VFKKITRAAGKIVKGAGKAVKSVAQSDIGKIAIAAGAVYFGGPAIAGMMGKGAAAASGASGFAGAATNVANAWSQLGAAGSALAAGNIKGAGSALASGMTGANATGALKAAGGLSEIVLNPAYQKVTAAQWAGPGSVIGAGTEAGGGLLSSASNGYFAGQVAGAGINVVGNALAGKAEQKQWEAQNEYNEEREEFERDRREANAKGLLHQAQISKAYNEAMRSGDVNRARRMSMALGGRDIESEYI
jgi:hypothetical protein